MAILGEGIIDTDFDEDVLLRRLEAMGDALPPHRVVIQYVYRWEDLQLLKAGNLQPGRNDSGAHTVQPVASTEVSGSYPELTEADGEELFASVLWFEKQRMAGRLSEYDGKYVAILGEQIIDVDEKEELLVRRLEAMESELPPNRVVIRRAI